MKMNWIKNLDKKYLIILVIGILIISLTFMGIYLIYLNNSRKNLKAEWYREALYLIRTKYTKIKIAIVYSEKWQNDDNSWSDLRIDSSPEALQAYKNGISPDYFIGKEGLQFQNYNITIPINGCYTGVFPGWGEYEDSVSTQFLIDFENLCGKSVAFVPFSVFWGQNNVSDCNLKKIDSYGAVPLIRLMPWGEPYWEASYQANYSLEKIINGDFDTFLSDWADIIKNFNKTVMITFGVEMNGNWFPWSGVFQGGNKTDGYGDPNKADGPEKYVDAFRHIVLLFKNKSVNNALWYFHPNHESYPDEAWNSIENYYPGDQYVDWIGFSLYGAQYNDENWVNFDEIMGPIYNKLTTIFTNKPLMLCE